MGSLPRVYFSVVLLLVNWYGPGEPDTVFGSPVFGHSASGCLFSMTGRLDTYQGSTTAFMDRGMDLNSSFTICLLSDHGSVPSVPAGPLVCEEVI